jgi:hypothetical protein
MIRKTVKKKIQRGGEQKGPPPIPDKYGGPPTCPMGYEIDNVFSIYDKINPRYSCKESNTLLGKAMREMMKQGVGIPGMAGMTGMAGMAMSMASSLPGDVGIKLIGGGNGHHASTSIHRRRYPRRRDRHRRRTRKGTRRYHI